MKKFFFALPVSVLFAAASAQAAVITETIPEFNYSGSAPYPDLPQLVGTYTYTIPTGQSIVSAVLSGTFGNSTVPNSAAADVTLNGLLVGQCLYQAACWTSSTPTAWSYTFTPGQFSLLSAGADALFARQTNDYVTRLGQTTLTITTATMPVPEPSEWALMASGLGLLGFVATRKAK